MAGHSCWLVSPSCPGTFGSSLGTELALPSQASSVSLCFARDDGLSPRSASHPEPGLRAEKWHSEKYPHAGTVPAACPPCPLPDEQELCHAGWRRASPPPDTLGSQSSHPHLHPLWSIAAGASCGLLPGGHLPRSFTSCAWCAACPRAPHSCPPSFCQPGASHVVALHAASLRRGPFALGSGTRVPTGGFACVR